MASYRIRIFYGDINKPARSVPGMSGLTLEEAQTICKDPQHSSKTCTTKSGKARTKKHGPWFYGYREE